MGDKWKIYHLFKISKEELLAKLQVKQIRKTSSLTAWNIWVDVRLKIEIKSWRKISIRTCWYLFPLIFREMKKLRGLKLS